MLLFSAEREYACCRQYSKREVHLRAYEGLIFLFPVEFYWAQNSLRVNDRTELAQFLVNYFIRESESVNEKSSWLSNTTVCALLNAQSRELKASINISVHHWSQVRHLHVLLHLTNRCKIQGCLIIQAGNDVSIVVLFHTLSSTLLNHVLSTGSVFASLKLYWNALIWLGDQMHAQAELAIDLKNKSLVASVDFWKVKLQRSSPYSLLPQKGSIIF